MRYIFILGRQPELGLAELERVFNDGTVTHPSASSAHLETSKPVDVQTLGGSIKAGKVSLEIAGKDWRSVSQEIVRHYAKAWSSLDRKQTLGVSVYDWNISTKQIQTLGLELKRQLKPTTTSLRLIPNSEAALNSAVSHHNKLGLSDNKVELLILKTDRSIIVAESVGAQNISALARRDQGRPKRDAFVGMLPPKLALLMVNLANPPAGARILDPFCGTGVVLQEAMLLGYNVYGTDLSEKMVDYSNYNLKWLTETHHAGGTFEVHHGDAVETVWQQPIGAVIAETYLGQPFNAPPAPDKLEQVRRNCDHIISKFLTNLAPQLQKGTNLCLAVPAWRDSHGNVTQLNLVRQLAKYGYKLENLNSVDTERLLYFREDQVVARQLLILQKD